MELARAACERLSLTCTIQVRRFDTLLDALADRQGDVVAAAIPLTAELAGALRRHVALFQDPGPFRRQEGPQPAGARTARRSRARPSAWWRTPPTRPSPRPSCRRATLKPFPDLAAAQAALKAGDIDYLFADGLSLALWIGGEEAADCCDFSGGPYLESRFFGEGIGFIVRKDDETLRRAFDYALQQLWKEGKYAELYLRFFPVSPF